MREASAVFAWLSRFLRGDSAVDADEPQLRQMLADLDRDQASFPLKDLRPVLVPTPIFETGQWVGPYHHFPDLPVSLTWAFLRPQQTMSYLSSSVAAALDERKIDWRAAARGALAREFDHHPWTHEFKSPGGKVEAVAFAHKDGLGPSRLIMYSKLIDQFPSGFSIFVPERSSAFLLCSDASGEVRSSVEKAVHGCFTVADVPMSETGYSHTLLKEALRHAGEGVP
jgi:hypothetical protein